MSLQAVDQSIQAMFQSMEPGYSTFRDNVTRNLLFRWKRPHTGKFGQKPGKTIYRPFLEYKVELYIV